MESAVTKIKNAIGPYVNEFWSVAGKCELQPERLNPETASPERFRPETYIHL